MFFLKKLTILVTSYSLYKNKYLIIWKKTMENHKMSKQDKIAYGITLAVIFFGLLFVGLIGVVVNIFG